MNKGTVLPKPENGRGQTFAQWLYPFSLELLRRRVPAPDRQWQVAAFNCNYLPDVAAYETDVNFRGWEGAQYNGGRP